MYPPSKLATWILISRGALLSVVDELMDQGQVTAARFVAVTGLALGQAEDALDPYAERLAAFRVVVQRRINRLTSTPLEV